MGFLEEVSLWQMEEDSPRMSEKRWQGWLCGRAWQSVFNPSRGPLVHIQA